jgi:hypothetical protein
MRRVLATCLIALGAGLGLVLGGRLLEPRPRPLPGPPAVVLRAREAARLETLDVSLYKKVSFAPEPEPSASLWGDVTTWVRYAVRAPHGKAIVFAEAHVALDLEGLTDDKVRVSGRKVWMVLPPLRVSVELKPEETEVIGSNLDSAQTARLFDLAKNAFEREVAADARLQGRARASAERAIRALLTQLGFLEVEFVPSLPAHLAS